MRQATPRPIECDQMRNRGMSHCGHIDGGLPCCQCGYKRPVSYDEARARIEELENKLDALEGQYGLMRCSLSDSRALIKQMSYALKFAVIAVGNPDDEGMKPVTDLIAAADKFLQEGQ